jgi:hypothetical protein
VAGAVEGVEMDPRTLWSSRSRDRSVAQWMPTLAMFLVSLSVREMAASNAPGSSSQRQL